MRFIKFLPLVLLLLTASADPLPGGFEPSTLPEPYREEITEVLKAAGGNRGELIKTLETGKSEGWLEAACFLISQMKDNDLDALQMGSQTLTEHIKYAYKAKQTVAYSVPEGLFFDYVLNYRILNEPVEAWRKELYDSLFPLIKDITSLRQAALTVNKWLTEKVNKTRPQVLIGSPSHILKAGKGDEEEICILTVAALRSVAIPSRVAYVHYLGEQPGGRTWVEIYDQDRWIPLYPDDPDELGNFHKLEQKYPYNITKAFARPYFQRIGRTQDYTQTGKLAVSVTASEKSGLSVAANVFNDGTWRPVEQTWTDEQGTATFELGEGEYLVTAGDRGQKVFLQIVTVKPDRTVECNFDFATDKSSVIEK